jgi:hypothetical protein
MADPDDYRLMVLARVDVRSGLGHIVECSDTAAR